MKRFLIFAVVRFLYAALPAAAASVTPAAATNYYFSTPAFPAHIRGEVMGYPPAYLTPRSEDWEWIEEAVQERRALREGFFPSGRATVLRPEFGNWDLAETNRFARWVTAVDAVGVTNVVVGYHLVTNSPPSNYLTSPSFATAPYLGLVARDFYNPAGTYGNFSGFLDPDVALITQSRAYAQGAHYFTNVYTVASYTNAVTNSISTIEVPMTNGTVSVHTNSWTADRRMPCTYTYTNVLQSSGLDYCHVGDGMFPGYTNAVPLIVAHFNHAAVLSNDYAALRGTLRLADVGRYPTNCQPASVYESYFMGEFVYRDTNNIAPGVGYGAHYHIGGEHYPSLKDYDDVTGAPIYEWVYGTEESHTVPVRHNVTLPTRFQSAVVTTGGVQRVTVEAAFAQFLFLYILDYRESGTNALDRVTTIQKDVVVPMAAPEILDTTDAATAYLTLTVDVRSILDAAAAASGAPSPPQSAAAFTPAKGHYEFWDAEWKSFILVYRLHPTSKFTDW